MVRSTGGLCSAVDSCRLMRLLYLTYGLQIGYVSKITTLLVLRLTGFNCLVGLLMIVGTTTENEILSSISTSDSVLVVSHLKFFNS